jgi:hypothetical protein
MSSCGKEPKLLAVGIAPLGIVSIGVVPMGVVSIGVVPMGVLSLGVVGMGVVNACVVGMGVLVAGVHAMGIWQLPLLAYPSQQEALEKAKELGCIGAHAMGSRWMPCAEHPH